MTKTATSELVPFWRTDAQPYLLFAGFHSDQPFTAASIAERFGLQRSTVNREARRLTTAEIFVCREDGRNHLLSINHQHPAVKALRPLVDLTIGPLVDLADMYAIDGVERVAIFGSWARRHTGEPGPAPADVDVLVVGNPSAVEVEDLCLAISGRYGISVNPAIIGADGHGAIAQSILAGPLVDVPR
jgi:hypothetical protein